MGEVQPPQAVEMEAAAFEDAAGPEAEEETPSPSTSLPLCCPPHLLILPTHSLASTPDGSLRRDLQLISLTLSAVG